MKLANRILTIGITSTATSLFSGLVFSLIWGGISGELLLPFFLISFPVVLFLGTPYSLLINHYLKRSGVSWFLLKLLLHAVGGLLIVFIWMLFAGSGTDALGQSALIFYIAALLNSIIYFIIFSLLKLTGQTGLD